MPWHASLEPVHFGSRTLLLLNAPARIAAQYSLPVVGQPASGPNTFCILWCMTQTMGNHMGIQHESSYQQGPRNTAFLVAGYISSPPSAGQITLAGLQVGQPRPAIMMDHCRSS